MSIESNRKFGIMLLRNTKLPTDTINRVSFQLNNTYKHIESSPYRLEASKNEVNKWVKQ